MRAMPIAAAILMNIAEMMEDERLAIDREDGRLGDLMPGDVPIGEIYPGMPDDMDGGIAAPPGCQIALIHEPSIGLGPGLAPPEAVGSIVVEAAPADQVAPPIDEAGIEPAVDGELFIDRAEAMGREGERRRADLVEQGLRRGVEEGVGIDM